MILLKWFNTTENINQMINLEKKISEIEDPNFEYVDLGEKRSISDREFDTLYKFIVYYKAKKYLEIGTGTGKTICTLANIFKETKFYSVDVGYLEIWNPDKRLFPPNVTFIKANSSRCLYECVPEVDIVFVDGSHAVPYVCIDSYNAFRKVREGGLVLWHDYKNDWSYNYGVKKALHDLKIKYKVIKKTHLAYSVKQNYFLEEEITPNHK